MALRTHFGAANVEKRYSGIAWRTDLIKTNLPAMLRARKVHEESFDSNLSRRDRHEVCLIAESERGAPRYLEGRWEMVNPRIMAIFL